AAYRSDLGLPVVGDRLDRGVAGRVHGQLEALVGRLRGHVQLGDMVGRHRLEPHGLPDAGGPGVEDAAVGHLYLIAVRRPSRVGPAGDTVDQLLRYRAGQRVGDVDGEPVVAAAVRGDLLAVDPDRGVVVDRAEVEHQPPAATDVPVRGHLER